MFKNILAIVFALVLTINITNAQVESSFMSLKGHIQLGSFDEGAAEILAYDAANSQLFVTNSENNTIDIVDISNPANLTLVTSIDISSYGDGINSVAVWGNMVAAAIEADVKQEPGKVVVFDTDGNYLWDVTAGALPDMVTFTPDGAYILAANEGEPNDDYSIDPDGSVTIINANTQEVMTADFTAWNGMEDELHASGIRIFGPNASVSQDLEPEYIATNAEGTTAWVSLQENNAFAIIDIETATVTDIVPLGTKDHSLPGNGLDASDKDDKVNIRNWPVKGFYLPDAIATYEVNGETYILSANEGDAREYDTFEEEVRVKDVELDPTIFDNIDWLQKKENLGRLAITATIGDLDNDGLYEELYSFGARSFTIWNSDAELVWDSGDDFEKITANVYGYDFNNNNDENEGDTRSDAKGPEPEAVTVGEINGEYYAFIGLERMGGIMVYNVTNPMQPEFVTYVNNRDFDAEIENAGDLGPECVYFIGSDDSPNGKNLVVVSNEVSGTVSVYEINDEPNTFKMQFLHASDLEGGVDAIDNAPKFVAIVDKLEDEVENSSLLLSGDNWIPSPFFNASLFVSGSVFADVYGDLYDDDVNTASLRSGRGRVDASIMNILGVDASALGNHEFDAATGQVAEIIAYDYRGEGDLRWTGVQFPYLSANLDFSEEGNLNWLYTSEILPNSDYKHLPSEFDGSNFSKKIAPATIIERNGEKIGVVGATTQLLQSITSTDNVSVIGPKENDMLALAEILQPYIDDMINNHNVNKVVVVTHLQQFALEKELIGYLSGVDIIFAGGSDHIMLGGSQEVYPGTEKEDRYPYVTENMDGEPAVIVSTDGEYRYVGRLIATFDENGVLEINSIDPRSGAYASTDNQLDRIYGNDDPFEENSKGELVHRLTDAVQQIVTAQDGNIFGKSDVYLEGRRSKVRTEESNLGNLTADANLFLAQTYDEEVMVSIKNGGGIRASIGEVVETEPGVYEFGPTTANPAAGKEAGDISQLDIANALRFNNTLTILELTPAELKMIIEHSISAWTETAQPGQFCQVGGIQFSFDPDAQPQELAFNEDGDIVGVETEGERVKTMVITNPHTGNIVDVVVKDGMIYGDPERTIKTVTLNFLADFSGDNYPYVLTENYNNRIDLTEVIDYEGNATFAEDGSEQDALAEFLSSHYYEFAYNNADTERAEDDRIQNLMYRNDDILDIVIDIEDISTCKTAPTEIGFEPVLCGNGFCDTFPQIEGGSDDLTFEWQPAFEFADPTAPNPVILNPRVNRTYTVIITDEVLGETFVENVDVTILDEPEISVPLFIMRSLGESIILNDLVTINSGTPDYVYNWIDGSSGEEIEGYDEITFDAPGIYRYYVNVTDNDGEGCASRTKRVIIFVSWYKENIADEITAGTNGNSIVYTYPNPAVNSLNILSEFAEYSNVELQLIDMSGRVIKSFNYSNIITIEKSIDVSELAAGTYFIVINSDNDKAIHKFIKQ